MSRLVRWFLFLLAILWPDFAAAQEPQSTISVSAGLGVSVSDDSGVFPIAAVDADFPLAPGFRGRVELELTGLPGDSSVSLNDPATFKAAGGTVALSLKLRDDLAMGKLKDGTDAWYVQQRIAVECAAASWTRIVTRDVAPRDRFVSEVSCGVRVEKRSISGDVERFVAARFGHSGIAGVQGVFTMAAIVEGQVQVVEVKGASLGLKARVDKALSGTTQGRDRFGVDVWGAF